MAGTSLLSLPNDILILLPHYLHNIEDYTNVSSSCKVLRACLQDAKPNTILRLAAAQERIFFGPAPYFLVAATARELGNWARQSDDNEHELATQMQHGVESLLELALEHCGLTTNRIRELYEMRFSIINPVYDIIDKCVGRQWHALPRFWEGGVSDAYTISAEPTETFWHLAIYGELFAPDFEPFLTGKIHGVRSLKVETRLEYVKYCIPDYATQSLEEYDHIFPDGRIDPRRAVNTTGPYAEDEEGNDRVYHQNNIALTWVIRSSRWRPHWKAVREQAGPDFQEGFDDGWWYVEDSGQDWRQRMWENLLVCQGLEGMGMMREGLREGWVGRVKDWREKISRMEKEADVVEVARQATLEYPYLLGDLRICASGWVLGT